MARSDDAARQEIVADKSAEAAAMPGRMRPSRMKKKAMTVVAKTSKKPSTHRCTTHHRQYSTIDRCVCWPQVSPAP